VSTHPEGDTPALHFAILSRFALFDVKHDRCAQPTGTDSMLLGSWSLPPSDPPVTSILDIGTGSGVLALMMAQHTHGIQVM
jgi:tRNA1Val (adenine37-N6)-methyltransferase